MSINSIPVEFPTPGLNGQPARLKGFLWKPEGNGPFPAIVYNHGSEDHPGEKADLGVFFVQHGYVLFVPHRRGHGQSPGTPIDEGIDDLVDQVSDVIAAIDYLKTVSHVDTHKIALAGGSFGGIMTMLTAQRKLRDNGHLGIRAALDFGGCAQSWHNDGFRQRMIDAVQKAQVPVYFAQAANDYSIEPSKTLAQTMAQAGLPHQMRIFPVYYRSDTPRVPGSEEDHKQGHGGFFNAPGEWGTSALAFLEPNLDITVPALPVAPATTDSKIEDNLDDHYVMRDSAVAPLGKLFVYIPGHGSIPQHHRIFLTEAAHAGYHVIGLSYPNDIGVEQSCQSQGPDCPEKVHLATIQGGSLPALNYTVKKASSILNRLSKLLKYLDQIQPGQGWDDFLNGDDPVWSKIALGGHSRGGATVAYMAKRLYKVERVVILAAPRDAVGSTPSAWIHAAGSVTPRDRYLGFYHVNDAFSAQELAALRILTGSSGPASKVDGAEWPFGNSQVLFTQRPEPDPHAAHNCPASDEATPLLDDGTPEFRKVWRYLLGH